MGMVERHMTFKDVPKMRHSTLRRLMARPTFADELELHRVDCLGSNGLLDNHAFLLAKQAEFASEPLLPNWLLTGADLIAAGWSPGPELGKALTAVQNAQLEGQVATREEALAWLTRHVSPPCS